MAFPQAGLDHKASKPGQGCQVTVAGQADRQVLALTCGGRR